MSVACADGAMFEPRKPRLTTPLRYGKVNRKGQCLGDSRGGDAIPAVACAAAINMPEEIGGDMRLKTKVLLLFGACVMGVVGYYGYHGFIWPVRYVKYDENGLLEEEGYIRRFGWGESGFNWTREGKWTKYMLGRKHAEGCYRASRPVGNWTWYNEDGSVYCFAEADRNGPLRETVYDEKGNPHVTFERKDDFEE